MGMRGVVCENLHFGQAKSQYHTQRLSGDGKFAPQDMANRLSLDMDAPARAVKRSQVLTVHGSKDETIPVADAHAYAERLAGGRLLVVDGADHNYKQPAATDALIKAAVGHIAGAAGES